MLGALSVQAASNDEYEQEMLAAVSPAPAEEPRQDTLKALTKVRPDSMLARDEPFPETPDLRGTAAKERDEALAVHEQRMAELEVIGDIAVKDHDPDMIDRVDDLRRREVQRFRILMQEFLYAMRVQLARGGSRDGE